MAETVWVFHIQMHIFGSVSNTAVHAMWGYSYRNARRLTDPSEMIRTTVFSSLRVRPNLSIFKCVILRRCKLLRPYSVHDRRMIMEH
jgi:hypothetical protein